MQFRNEFLNLLLEFIWEQWSSLGVPGHIGNNNDKKFIIDPEALLIFSLPIARYEPRLFEEIENWTLKNGKWLDASRLRNFLLKENLEGIQLTGAVFQSIIRQAKTQKWAGLSELCWRNFKQQSKTEKIEILYKEKNGAPYPLSTSENADPSFARFQLNRPSLRSRNKSGEVPFNPKSNIRFYFRSLFGVGSRSEILLYLFTHKEAHAREIAESVELFWLGVQETLIDLSKSGLVQKFRKSKKVKYRLSHKQWQGFIYGPAENFTAGPLWVNWKEIFLSLMNIWNDVNEVGPIEKSNYLVSSIVHHNLGLIQEQFSQAGIETTPLPALKEPYNDTQEKSLQLLNRLLLS
ncbi:MAG: hypothetical protein KCHDKBKB_01804 [Elusimicrobia bacterium]|nr:hypothetical protein [Elusimicrobiota bacterium]